MPLFTSLVRLPDLLSSSASSTTRTCARPRLPVTSTRSASSSRARDPAPLRSDSPLPDELPDPPTHGSPSTPLKDILAWHTEMTARRREVRAAEVAHQAAASQEKFAAAFVEEARRRERFAFNRYAHLVRSVMEVNLERPVARAPFQRKGMRHADSHAVVSHLPGKDGKGSSGWGSSMDVS